MVRSLEQHGSASARSDWRDHRENHHRLVGVDATSIAVNVPPPAICVPDGTTVHRVAHMDPAYTTGCAVNPSPSASPTVKLVEHLTQARRSEEGRPTAIWRALRDGMVSAIRRDDHVALLHTPS